MEIYESCNILGIWDIEQANRWASYFTLVLEKTYIIIQISALINAIHNIKYVEEKAEEIVGMNQIKKGRDWTDLA